MIEILSIHYHRNGITGTAFYAGEMADDDGHYTFVQFVDDISHTSVFRLGVDGVTDIETTLRGDYFADAIKKKIDEVQTP